MKYLLIILSAFSLINAQEKSSELITVMMPQQFTTVLFNSEIKYYGNGTADIITTFDPGRDFTNNEIKHLYSKDIPKTGVDGVGRPTLVEIKKNNFLIPIGKLSSLEKVIQDSEYPHYPDGTVTIIRPVKWIGKKTDKATVSLLFTYMACSNSSCDAQITDQEETVTLDGSSFFFENEGASNNKYQNSTIDNSNSKQAPTENETHTQNTSDKIKFLHPKTVEEMEFVLDKAKKEGKSVLLEFTGPSCPNCIKMERSVFKLPKVIKGWNSTIALSINTDLPSHFSLWQQDKFKTSARPFYARVNPDESNSKWSKVFSKDDEKLANEFVDFLTGGKGNHEGTGKTIWGFILLAILGGLFTLIMPCTYPMIPLTINFFTKQSANGKKIMPLAFFYSFGIIASFTGLGIFITFIVGSTTVDFASNVWVNLAIALLFIGLGLSLLGMFFLRLPYKLQVLFEGKGNKGGIIGALIMGLTFAVTAFTCTAPFAGSVLSEGLNSNNMLRPALGMMIYSSVIALPFFVLALIPSLLNKLPKAGSWMDEFKHIGGIIEIAAALKFLSIVDNAWGIGFIERSSILSSWSVMSLFCGAYILGFIRIGSDKKLEAVNGFRLILSMIFVTFAVWLLSGLFAGNDLGLIETFYPQTGN